MPENYIITVLAGYTCMLHQASRQADKPLTAWVKGQIDHYFQTAEKMGLVEHVVLQPVVEL